ncbi:hypothetical protein FOZ63_020007, partial [Perkinsus olseni]
YQVLREVVALCAEASPNDDTLKAAVGVVASSSSSSSIQLDTGVSSSQYTPAELVAAVALVRAWWMAYYTQEGDHNHEQQQQSLEEHNGDSSSSSNKRGDVDMTTALCNVGSIIIIIVSCAS